MENWLLAYTVDMAKGDQAVALLTPNVLALSGDNLAHTWMLFVLRDGMPANLSGATATAYFIRNDGNTVVVAGTVAGNVCSYTMLSTCYAVVGPLRCVLKIYSSTLGTVTLMDKIVQVRQGVGGQIIDPGQIIPSLDELYARLDAMQQATTGAIAAKDNANSVAAGLESRIAAGEVNATNLVTNGGFSSGTTGWAADSASLSAAANILSITGTGTSPVTGVSQAIGSIIAAHKYYFACMGRSTNAIASALLLRMTFAAGTNTTIFQQNTPVQNAWYRLSGILAQTDQAGTMTLIARANYASAGAASGQVVQFSNIIALDLTAVFGAGNEPTAAQMDAYLAYWSNSWFDGSVNLTTASKEISALIKLESRITAGEVNAMNLITNGRFSDATGWSADSASLSAAAYNLSITGNGASAATGAYQMLGSIVSGHKYYFTCMGRVTNTIASALYIRLIFGAGTNVTVDQRNTPVKDAWYRFSGVLAQIDQTGTMTLHLRGVYASAGDATGQVAQFAYVLALDLTAVFGAGNEPTAAQMDAYLAYWPNSWFDGAVNLLSSSKMIRDLIRTDDPIFGKRSAWAGDSICRGYGYAGGYAGIIGGTHGMTVQNSGVDGATLAVVSGSAAICNMIPAFDLNSDYIIVEGGTNDAMHIGSGTETLGELSSGYIAELNNATLAGAIESICKQLVVDRAGKKVGYVIPVWSRQNADWIAVRAMIKSACEKWGVPYLDLGMVSPPLYEIVSLKQAYTYNGDGIHPNEVGYRTFYVPQIEAWMARL